MSAADTTPASALAPHVPQQWVCHDGHGLKIALGRWCALVIVGQGPKQGIVYDIGCAALHIVDKEDSVVASLGNGKATNNRGVVLHHRMHKQHEILVGASKILCHWVAIQHHHQFLFLPLVTIIAQHLVVAQKRFVWGSNRDNVLAPRNEFQLIVKCSSKRE